MNCEKNTVENSSGYLYALPAGPDVSKKSHQHAFPRGRRPDSVCAVPSSQRPEPEMDQSRIRQGFSTGPASALQGMLTDRCAPVPRHGSHCHHRTAYGQNPSHSRSGSLSCEALALFCGSVGAHSDRYPPRAALGISPQRSAVQASLAAAGSQGARQCLSGSGPRFRSLFAHSQPFLSMAQRTFPGQRRNRAEPSGALQYTYGKRGTHRWKT